jgi:hypothetical protein
MGRWRVGLRWYLVAVAVPLAFFRRRRCDRRRQRQGWPRLVDLGRYRGLPEVGISASGRWRCSSAATGEETGWRDYALPELQRRPRPAGRHPAAGGRVGGLALATVPDLAGYKASAPPPWSGACSG